MSVELLICQACRPLGRHRRSRCHFRPCDHRDVRPATCGTSPHFRPACRRLVRAMDSSTGYQLAPSALPVRRSQQGRVCGRRTSAAAPTRRLTTSWRGRGDRWPRDRRCSPRLRTRAAPSPPPSNWCASCMAGRRLEPKCRAWTPVNRTKVTRRRCLFAVATKGNALKDGPHRSPVTSQRNRHLESQPIHHLRADLYA
jgi:hypothetical protein